MKDLKAHLFRLCPRTGKIVGLKPLPRACSGCPPSLAWRLSSGSSCACFPSPAGQATPASGSPCLASLGVHEHWNNPADKQYTRNLGTGSGIELLYLTSDPAASTVSLDLVAGWNLVSFNLHPLNTGIASVLSSLSGSYSLVYAWDASASSDNWLTYDPRCPAYANDLTSLAAGWGYWIYVTASHTWDVEH